MNPQEISKKKGSKKPLPEKRYGTRGIGSDYQPPTIVNMSTDQHKFKGLGIWGASVTTDPNWNKASQVKPAPYQGE